MTFSMLDESRDRTLKTSVHGPIVLTHAIAVRMVASWTLAPAPQDPILHLEAAHARARQHLERLTAHDPAHEVASVMTGELYSRLTDAHPAPLSPAGVERYTY